MIFTDSPILDGQRVHYNHIPPHQALQGKTPPEAAGVGLDPDANKWESLIRKAAPRPKRG